MCIRDRSIPSLNLPIYLIIVPFFLNLISNIQRMLLIILKTYCLLYTSDACRRIERCPSRGLGDVYKRQIYTLSKSANLPDNRSILSESNIKHPKNVINNIENL